MRNFESRCADIQSKIRTLSSEEVNVEDISAFTDAVSDLLDDVILEVEQAPKPTRRSMPATRRKAMPLPRSANSSRAQPVNPAPAKEAKNSTSSTTFKNIRNLIAFLVVIKATMGDLSEIAQNAPNLEGFPSPTDILNKLTEAYDNYIEPMIETLEQNVDNIEKASTVASLGIAVLATCRELNNYRDKMDTNEKIYAVCGTVLMFAGLGMLIAATINPTTMPVIAAVAVVTLGVYLCQRSLERHKNNEAKKINGSLDNVHANIKQVSKRFKISGAVVDAMKFSAATASRVKENVPPPPTWVTRASMTANRFTNTMKDFMRGFF